MNTLTSIGLFFVLFSCAEYSIGKAKNNRRPDINLSEFACIGSSENCRLVDVYPDVAQSRPDKRAIVIIDHGMQIASRTLYKDRVTGRYRANPSTGGYFSDRSIIKLPKGLVDLNATLRVRDIRKYTRSQLNEIYDSFDIKEGLLGHGDPIFNTLARLTRSAEFVLIDDSMGFPDWARCGSAEDSELFFKSKLEDLNKILRHHKADWIVGAWGYDETTLSRVLGQCDTAKRRHALLKSYNSFVRKLLQHHERVFFQASPYSISDSDTDPGGDCSDLQGRLRFGHAFARQNIPESGRNYTSFDKPRFSPTQEDCTDIFINIHYDSAKPPTSLHGSSHLFGVGVLGFDSTLILPSSSFILPFGVAYAHFVEKKNHTTFQSFFNRDEKSIHDPVKYKHFESIFRNGAK